jgi:hypothetical protein
MSELKAIQLVVLIICVCLLISTIVLIGMLINQALKVRKFSSPQWTSIEATITQSQLNTLPTKYRNVYTASIVFHYDVDGKTYSSSLITPDLLTSTGVDREYGSNLITLFPLGKRVQAYYSKRNHSVAVLFPCNTQWTWFTVGYHSVAVFGFLMLLPSIIYVYFNISKLHG